MAKRASHKNTFGWVRMEVLGALVNADFLIALCFSIIMEAIARLVTPQRMRPRRAPPMCAPGVLSGLWTWRMRDTLP